MSITPRADWYNLTKLQTEVQYALRDESISSTILTAYINKAYKWMFYDQLWPERKTKGTITLVSGQSEYELPSDVDIVEFAAYGTNSYLIQNTGENKREYGAIPQSNGDRRMIIDGYMSSIYPVPGDDDAGQTFDIYYWKKIYVYSSLGAATAGGLVNATDYPALDGSLHQLLADKAAIIAMKYNREESSTLARLEQDFYIEYEKIKFNKIMQPSLPKTLRIRL